MNLKQITTLIAVIIPFGIPLLLSIALIWNIKKRYFGTKNQRV